MGIWEEEEDTKKKRRGENQKGEKKERMNG